MTRRGATVAALAVLSVSCSTGHPAEPGAAGVTTAVSVPPTTAVSVPPAHIGDTLQLTRIGQQRIAVTLTRIVDPATVPHGWGDPGTTYVATELSLTNTGSTTIVGNSNSDVAVVGSDGRDYRADFATVTECQNFLSGWFLLAPGASTTGCVVFALPPDVRPAKVRYTPSSGISRDVGEWLNT